MFVAYEAVLDMKVTFITMPLPGTEHWISYPTYHYQCLRIYFLREKCQMLRSEASLADALLWSTDETILPGTAWQYSEKSVPVPLCAPQIPHGLTLQQNRASAVWVRRLTAWATASPYFFMF
jgi:hypothetical protein